jgi:DNA-binding IclR family transcriptional regulator
LNEKYPAPLSCTEIADEIARDNEFVARVLAFLKEKNLVRQVLKNSNGKDYLRWTKWTLSPSTRAKFEALE